MPQTLLISHRDNEISFIVYYINEKTPVNIAYRGLYNIRKISFPEGFLTNPTRL